MKTYLHGPMDDAKSLKLRFHVGNLDLPERRVTLLIVVERKRKKVHRCALVANHHSRNSHSGRM